MSDFVNLVMAKASNKITFVSMTTVLDISLSFTNATPKGIVPYLLHTMCGLPSIKKTILMLGVYLG